MPGVREYHAVLGDVDEEVDRADHPALRVAQGRGVGHEPHACSVGPLRDRLDATDRLAGLERDRHRAFVVGQACAVEPIEPPRPAPQVRSEGRAVAPELGGGLVVEGDPALGVGGVDRRR